MARKKLAAAVAAMGALQANPATALGMGEFSLHSALNQPLNAEIKLLDTRDLDEAQLKISLASTKDFERAGVSRDYFLTNLKFKVLIDSRGNGAIKVTTHDPVVEPYLNFVVEARWPSGRLLREYTVLLDLPVFSDSDTAPVSAASAGTEQPAPVRTTASVPAMKQARSDRQTLTQGTLQAGEKYRVREDETLWEIAAKGRPSQNVSVQQTMVSIQRLNPSAFIGGNINRLKAGYVLRLPTSAEINDVSGREAIQEVASQNRAWKSGETTAANTGGAQLDATSTTTDSEGGYAEEARLSIATAGDSDAAVSGEGGGGSAALRSQLDVSLENLDKTQRENTELQSRLGDMEAKIATLQRLLELKDDQLAALQDNAADTQAGKPAMSDESTMDATATDETMESGADTEAMAGDGGMDSMAGQPVEEPATKAEVKPVPAPAPDAEPELLDQLLENPLYLAGGAGLIVLALVAMLIIRKRKSEEAQEDAELELFEESDEDLADVSLEDDGLDHGDLEQEGDDKADLLAAELEQEIAAANAEASLAEEQEPASVVQSETGDAIAEADIYIAYGRYQQAVDLLATAISQEPQRSDLQVKLLEVYVETRDKPGFQRQYVALQALGDEAAIGEVKEMLSSVDGVADWLEGLPGAAGSDFSDVDMDADLIDDGDDIELDLDDDLEIDLDLDDMSITQETEAVSLDADDLDDDLDLELDLDESNEESSDGITRMLDAVSLESTDDDELGEFSLGEDLELDEELDLELGAENDTLDLGELDLGDDLESPVTSGADVEADGEEEGFELDLDGDGDLDLELGDMDDTDLSDLEAEFGESTSTEKDSVEETEGSLDVNLNAADELGDIDLEDLDLSEGETVTLDAGSTELDLAADDGGIKGELGDLELSAGFDTLADGLDDESAADELSLSEESLDTPTFDLDMKPAADVDESFDESVSATTATPVADDDFDFLADTDEVATKLDLARAYIDMGDTEGAKDILDEVMQEGSDEQKQEANELLERV